MLGLFGPQILSYSQNLASLRDFLDLLAPYVESSTHLKPEHALMLMPLRLMFNRLDPELFPIKECRLECISTQGGQGPVFDLKIEEKTNVKSKTVRISGPAALDLAKAFPELKTWFKRTHHTERLYGSTLVSLVSTTEWFISQILHQYYRKFPGTLGAHEKRFSLEDLRSFSSLQSAEESLISARVEERLRQSFEDLVEFFKKHVTLGMEYLDQHLNNISEVYQRRNLLVHNESTVNATYLSKVHPDLKGDITKGQKIGVGQTYVENSIGLFEWAFILIAAELWKRIDPKDEERGSLLNSLAFEHLLDERWVIAARLSQFVMKDTKLAESTSLSGKLNYWQALKWQGRYEEIRPDVESADFSAKDQVFQLSLWALRDDKGKFFGMLPAVMNSGKLKYGDVASWSIFRGMRQLEDYEKFRRDNEEKFLAEIDALPQDGGDTQC